MKIERITHGQWGQAYRLTHNDMEMIVVTEIGPRIMSFRLDGGQNVLYEDHVGFHNGDWRLYGGHRFWIAPETVRSFDPDNDPCEVEIEENLLRVLQRPDVRGLQKIIEIEPDEVGGGFTVRHKVHNRIELLSVGAMWVLTCVVPNRVLVPWGAGSNRWHLNKVQYWSQWAGHKTNVASPQWQQTNDYFLVDPTMEEGKAGVYTERGFMALLRTDETFIKRFAPIVGAEYPDGGCNVELYTCKHFIEMETLSPLYTYNPGMEYTHTEHWLLSKQTFEPENWEQIKDLLPAGVDLIA